MTPQHTSRTRWTRLSTIAVAGVAGIALLGACAENGASSGDRTVTEPAESAETSESEEVGPAAVNILQSRFGTLELRISRGTTVVWTNEDGFAHTVTSRDGAPVAFDSGEFGEGETFEFTFDEPGEYAYFCEIHPTMRAVVIVE